MRITLTVTSGPHLGRVFEFSGHDTFLVGRSRHAHMQLSPQDRYCSRIHFMVEVNPPHCRLMDMGSNNGTHVNGTETAAKPSTKAEAVRLVLAAGKVMPLDVSPTSASSSASR